MASFSLLLSCEEEQAQARGREEGLSQSGIPLGGAGEAWGWDSLHAFRSIARGSV